MVAVLKPIESRAIERPKFDNTQIKHVCLWVRDNQKALQGYYAELGKTLPADEDNNLTGFAKAQAFAAWVQCQHDRESGRF
jgi:hypothetical protein